MDIQCPGCGKSVDQGLAKCPHCGADLPAQRGGTPPPVPEAQESRICYNCGAEIPANSAHCPNCGFGPARGSASIAEKVLLGVLFVLVGVPAGLFGACAGLFASGGAASPVFALMSLGGLLVFGLLLSLWIRSLKR